MPRTAPSGTGWAEALLLFTILIWGVNFSVVKVGLATLPPLAFNAVRFVVAAGVLLGIARALGHRLRFARRHLPGLLGLGLLGNAAYQLVFIYGAAWTTADNAALILSTVPAWVAAFGTLSGLDRVAPRGWLGIGLTLVGIGLIVVGGDRAAHFPLGGPTLAGDLLILVATICWSATTLLVRLAVRHYSPLSVTAFCTAVGAVPLIVLGLPELLRLDRATVTKGAWAAAGFSGLFAIALSYVFWNIGVSRLGSARTAAFANITPVVALLTAWLWLGERLTPVQCIGTGLVLAGVALARRYVRARAV